MAAFQTFFSIFFFCFFFLPQIASSATICKPSSCDGIQNPPVKFPFRLKGSQDEACGYDPWFDLSCNDQDQIILTLPFSGHFVVVDIKYSVQWLYIVDPEQCIYNRFLHNFSLSGSPFEFHHPPYLHQNSTFYNCSSKVKKTHGYRPIDCLGSDDYKVLMARIGHDDDFPPPATCREIGTAVVPILQMDDSLLIRWGEPSCQRCEESGGDCARLNATSPEVGCYNVQSNSQTGSSMAAPSCQNILREMRPCVPYLRRHHHQPSHACCNGVRYVGRYFNSNRYRRAACECFTTSSSLSLFGRVQTSAITSLHGSCDVSIRMPHASRGRLECSRF